MEPKGGTGQMITYEEQVAAFESTDAGKASLADLLCQQLRQSLFIVCIDITTEQDKHDLL